MQVIESLLNSWHAWSGYVPGFLAGRRGAHPSCESPARALGYGANARLLIINIDDAGMCRSHNLAVRDCFASGGATSCTVMTTTPGFEEFAAMARRSPRWSVGVHLTLTSEWPRLRWGPLVGSAAAPSLVDADGHFYPTLVESITRCRPGEVAREWRAQIRRALDHGMDVDHLDCHMGPYHFRPRFFRIALSLAREFGLAMRVAAPWRTMRARSAGVFCGDWPLVIMHREGGERLWRTVDERRRQILGALSRLRPGVTFWWTHISRDGDEWRGIRPPDEDLDKEDYPGEHRDQYEERITDHAVLSDPGFPDAVRALGITLISYRELRALGGRKRNR